LKSLFGEVLNENTTMLAMCRQLGFEVRGDPHEQRVSLVSLDLAKARAGTARRAS
jgi:acetyltransferase